jgi:predicted permease
MSDIHSSLILELCLPLAIFKSVMSDLAWATASWPTSYFAILDKIFFGFGLFGRLFALRALYSYV